MSTYIAVDFGGGSGRVMAGHIENGRVTLDEVYRFSNRIVSMGNHLYWDFPMLLDEMMKGLKNAAAAYPDIVSIGIDSWGVDYGLVDSVGDLLGNPRCYRDEANSAMLEKFAGHSDLSQYYSQVGIQVLPINTMFQLMVRKHENPNLLELASHLLFMSDLFGYYLTGVPGCDYCLATTSGLVDARNREWNFPLIDSLGLPRHIFGRLLTPGCVRGSIQPSVASATGLSPNVKVIAVGGHDTACAVHAVPFEKGRESVSAYLSSGTWSLLGARLNHPVLTEEARLAGFTNEGGTGGSVRFLQNITGLWILQCLIDRWRCTDSTLTYDALTRMAEESDYTGVIDVENPIFATAGDMERKVLESLAADGFNPPAGMGDVVRCVLLSLANRYKQGIDGLNKFLPSPVERLHIIGGGSKNRLLNALTAEATGLEVIPGPVEATAIGSILMQAQAQGNAIH